MLVVSKVTNNTNNGYYYRITSNHLVIWLYKWLMVMIFGSLRLVG